MNCPFCGKEMLTGAVQSGKPFCFTTKPYKKWYQANMASLNGVGVSHNNETVPTCTAYRCVDCKKVILDYSKDANQE